MNTIYKNLDFLTEKVSGIGIQISMTMIMTNDKVGLNLVPIRRVSQSPSQKTTPYRVRKTYFKNDLTILSISLGALILESSPQPANIW